MIKNSEFIHVSLKIPKNIHGDIKATAAVNRQLLSNMYMQIINEWHKSKGKKWKQRET